MLNLLRSASIVLISLFTLGCAPQPKTLDELRKVSQTGKYMTKYKEYRIHRPFKAVYSDIERLSERCLHMTEESQSMSWGHGQHPNYVESYSRGFHPEVFQTSDRKGHLTVLADDTYAFGMDMAALGEKETKLAVYGARMNFGELHEGAVNWAKGESDECPAIGAPGSKKRNRTTD